MTDEEIQAAFGRLGGALAPPMDGPQRIGERIAVRRRRRRAAIAGTAALAVVATVGTVAVLGSGDDGGGDTVAVDQPSGPVSTLVMTRPDGSTYAFDDVTVSCEPPKVLGEGSDTPAGRIWMFSPISFTGKGDDARASEPFLYFEGLVAELGEDTTYDLPFDSVSGDSDERAFVLFVADSEGNAERGNEVSSAEPGSAGTVRVVKASCDPTPVLQLAVDATLGSEVEQGTVDIAGGLR